MLKKFELSSPTSCLNKSASDEPIFVLRAKDPYAPQAIRHWAAMAEGHHEPSKIQEALGLANAMDKYREANYPTPPNTA